LNGVSEAIRSLPDLQLWCHFGSAPLLDAVCTCVDRDPALRTRVHLMGSVPHARVELLMRAADVFVLGSHWEGSGYALIEALACGLPPVVTDIPPFRSLIGNGDIGRLWPCADAHRLAEALTNIARRPRDELRNAVLAHFAAEASFAAVGRKLLSAYEWMAERSATAVESRTRSVA